MSNVSNSNNSNSNSLSSGIKRKASSEPAAAAAASAGTKRVKRRVVKIKPVMLTANDQLPTSQEENKTAKLIQIGTTTVPLVVIFGAGKYNSITVAIDDKTAEMLSAFDDKQPLLNNVLKEAKEQKAIRLTVQEWSTFVGVDGEEIELANVHEGSKLIAIVKPSYYTGKYGDGVAFHTKKAKVLELAERVEFDVDFI